MSELTLSSAVDLVEMLRTERISPLELAEEFIREIERLNPQLNAIIDFDADRIRQQALGLQESKARRGPLFGIPITIKASISVAGYRCETGSQINRGHIPAQDATVVSRLKEAGAIVLGTTNCPEFLMAYETDNLLYGRTSNPADLSRSAGGSSGGEAAAIAAGISAGGLGSDGGGSVREPAHFTGICALKPTPGRIPGTGHLPPCVGPFALLGTIGPMARSIADVKLLFETIAGQDRVEPCSSPVPLKSYSLQELKRMPIGFFEDDGLVPVTSETRTAVQLARRALERQGFNLRPFGPKVFEAARKLWFKFFVQCGAMLLEPAFHGREKELSPIFQDFLGIAAEAHPLSANELLFAWAESDTVRSTILEEMQRFPILLSPVCAVPAFRHGERSWIIEGQEICYLDAMRFTQWFNLLGAPAAVVPISRSEEGLPIGVQLAGLPYEDEAVLAIAAVLDSEFGFTPSPFARS